MTSTADEDWSIISSSDYEDDSGSAHSVSREDGPAVDQENYEEDLSAASVSTVRPDSQSNSLKGPIPRVGFSPGSASTAPVLGSNVAPAKSANRPGAARELLGTDETGTETALLPSGPAARAAPSAPLAPLAPSAPAPSASYFRAPFVAPYAAVRSAVAHTAQCLRKTDAAAKRRSDEIFRRPLKSLHAGLDSFCVSSPAAKTITKNVIEFLEASTHLLLYFVIIAAISACAGGSIYGTKAIMSSSSASTSTPTLVDPVWGTHFREVGVGSADSHGVTSWTQKTSFWLVGFKDTCSQQARKVWNLALYEDDSDNLTWFERFFHHTPSKKLRFSKFWSHVDNKFRYSWHSMQNLRTKYFSVPFHEKLQIDRISDTWSSVYRRAKFLVVDPATQARFNQWKSSLVVFGQDFARVFNASALRNWNELCFATQVGVNSGSQILKQSFNFIKKSVFFNGPADFKDVFSHQSKELGKRLKYNFAWVSSTAQQLGGSFSSIASECQTRVDTVEKRQQLVNTFKEASQSGVAFFNKRLQIAALDVYRMTKSVAASMN